MEHTKVKSEVQQLIVDYLKELKVSQRGFGDAVGMSDSAWNKYKDMGHAMSVPILDKILLAYPGVRAVLNNYLTGNNMAKLTPKDKMLNNDENHKASKETFYRDLIENNQEYSLLPKAVLRDYKIVPDKLLDIITTAKDEVNKELRQKQDIIIESYENRIKKLEEEKEDLRRQIPPKQWKKYLSICNFVPNDIALILIHNIFVSVEV